MAMESSQNGNLRRSQRIARAQLVVPFLGEESFPVLPNELIEGILQYLATDREAMLNCRLVNKTWRDETDKFLERSCHQNWKTWCPTFALFPKLQLVADKRPRSTCLPSVQVPLGLKEYQGKPFPTQCVILTTRDLENVKGKYESLGCNVLLHSIGLHVTTFIFDGVTITLSQLGEMLNQLVSLKAMSLSNVNLKEVSKKNLSTKASEVKPVHSLLPIQSFRAIEDCDARIIEYMVDRFVHQLVNLEVEATKLKPLQQQQEGGLDKAGKSEEDPYKNLKQLKLSSPSKSFLELSGYFALQNLCISDIEPEHNITPKTLFKFIDNFSKTLVYLRLDVDFKDLKMEPRELEVFLDTKRNSLTPIGATFSKLCKLDIRNPSLGKMEDGWTFIKRHLLPKFPALEYLHFLPMFRKTVQFARSTGGFSGHKCENILSEVSAKMQFNLVCPKLKCVMWRGATVRL